MRILKISDVYFPRVNGVSTSVSTLRQELLARGHLVTLVVPGYETNGQPEAGIERVAGRRVPFDPEDRIMRSGPLRELQRRLLARSFDVVHIHTPFVAHRIGLRMARALDLPAVETYHTYFEEYFHHYIPFVPRRVLGLLARGLARRQCNRVERVIVPSQAMRQVLEDYGVRGSVRVIPTGLSFVEMQGGDRHRFRRRHAIAAERPVLLHVGRMAFEKNISFLIEVLKRVRARVPNVLFVLAGEGPASGSIRSLVERLGLAESVRFVGYLSRDGSLQDCYAAADLFVFASRTETQGLVLLEAMAFGLPVVSTAVMGTRDIVGQEMGAVVAQEDAADFSRQVVQLLKDRQRLKGLRRQAVEFSRRWSVEAMTDRMLHLYQDVIEEKQGEREQ